MTRFADYFSEQSNNYLAFRPDYPAALFDYLANISPAQRHAWDCGCGNGQASIALAQHFAHVSATDASAAQIAQAIPHPRVRYAISSAEKIATADNSLDLITVAQAVHWFDHDAFFAEVARCLKPGGVMAAWGYQLLYTDTALDAVVEEFHTQVVGAYWPKGRELLDAGYSKIQFPFPRAAAPAFEMRKQWEFGHLLGYLNTWSAVKQYQLAKGHNPVELYFEKLKAAWGDEQSSKDVYWPLILYVGRKS